MALESHVNITLVPEPTSPDHLVPARWVTAFVGGLQKAPVRLAATAPQAGSFDLGDKEFTYAAQGPVTIDGEVLAQGESVLFAGQTDETENLIYECTHQGVAGTDETILTLRDDSDEDSKLATGQTVAVSEGTVHAGTTFRLTTQGTIILGATALEWEPYVQPKSTTVFFEEFDASTGTATAAGGMEWEIEHKLNNVNVLVQLYNRDDNTMILAEVQTTDNNTVTVTFTDEPAGGAGYRAVIIG